MYKYLKNRAIQSNDWNKESMSREKFTQLLIDKIEQVLMDDIKEDIVRFIPDDKPLEIWSRDYFKELAKLIRFVDK